MTNFEKVVDFNKKFGVKTFDVPQQNVFDEHPKLVELRMNLIKEEWEELNEAVTQKDIVETVDALADILYVVYGMGASIGVNLDEAFKLVHESNMSKLCKTEEEAKQTVEWYKQQFSAGQLPYDEPTYREDPSKEYWVVYNATTGKILKSVNYKMVNLSYIKN